MPLILTDRGREVRYDGCDAGTLNRGVLRDAAIFGECGRDRRFRSALRGLRSSDSQCHPGTTRERGGAIRRAGSPLGLPDPGSMRASGHAWI